MADRRSPKAPSEHIAEVVESSTTLFVAECRELHVSPAFGSFVRVESTPSIYGVVFQVLTHSMEPNRRVTAYGKTEEELRLEQPQIFELLKTEIRVLVVGFRDEAGGIRQFLPPQPPRIHSFVYACSPAEVREFTVQTDYLRTLLGVPGLPADELLIASTRAALGANGGDEGFLLRTCKEIAMLFCEDYGRLTSILRRIGQ